MTVYEKFLEELKEFGGIPSPFFTKNNKLYRVDAKNGEEQFISRQVIHYKVLR